LLVTENYLEEKVLCETVCIRITELGERELEENELGFLEYEI
jgi:hypothetical protein